MMTRDGFLRAHDRQGTDQRRRGRKQHRNAMSQLCTLQRGRKHHRQRPTAGAHSKAPRPRGRCGGLLACALHRNRVSKSQSRAPWMRRAPSRARRRADAGPDLCGRLPRVQVAAQQRASPKRKPCPISIQCRRLDCRARLRQRNMARCQLRGIQVPGRSARPPSSPATHQGNRGLRGSLGTLTAIADSSFNIKPKNDAQTNCCQCGRHDARQTGCAGKIA